MEYALSIILLETKMFEAQGRTFTLDFKVFFFENNLVSSLILVSTFEYISNASIIRRINFIFHFLWSEFLIITKISKTKRIIQLIIHQRNAI